MTKRRTSPRCTVCQHPERWRIELLKASGVSLNSLAAKFAPLSRDSIHRHWIAHVSSEARASYLLGPSDLENWAAKAAQEGDGVLDYLKLCRTTLVSQLAAANEAGDGLLATRVAVALTAVLGQMAKVTGEVNSLAILHVTNNLQLGEHPVFARMRAALLTALAPFPEARMAVVQALRSLDADNAPTAATGHAIKVLEHVQSN